MNTPPTTARSSPSATLSVGNPFTPGGVITLRDKLFGRKKALSAIEARLRGMLSVSVVGEARMGKSSLLKVLEAEVARWDGYLPIYLSMDAHRTQESFCRALLKQLLPHVRPPSDNNQENEATLRDIEKRVAQRDAFTFEDTVEVLELASAWGLRVVLLLDEFKELLERADEFDDAFRGQLRSLYNTNRTVALVLATRQPITHIPQLNAYFANGITMHELNPLHPNAAKALLAQPHDRPFSEKEINLGLQVAKHHPLRLQLVGFQLYFWKTQATNPLYHATTHLHFRKGHNSIIWSLFDHCPAIVLVIGYCNVGEVRCIWSFRAIIVHNRWHIQVTSTTSPLQFALCLAMCKTSMINSMIDSMICFTVSCSS